MLYFTRAATIVTPDPSDASSAMEVYDDTRTMTVFEDDLETFTGLYDADGREIHCSHRAPMGFKL